jgi:hypothetical protein
MRLISVLIIHQTVEHSAEQRTTNFTIHFSIIHATRINSLKIYSYDMLHALAAMFRWKSPVIAELPSYMALFAVY